MKSRVVLALSGGMDSAALLGILAYESASIIAVSFKYPSKHNEKELKAAKDVVDYYARNGADVSHRIIDVSSVFNGFASNLLKSGGAIPEGHYAEESMKQTVVPSRNLIFASILAGIAESEGGGHIALGVHSGDHAIYPDCRPDFIEQLEKCILLSSEDKVKILTPLLKKTKTNIITMNKTCTKIPIPFHLTRTCYNSEELACGRCGSCNERLEAFALNGLTDPIQYKVYEKE